MVPLFQYTDYVIVGLSKSLGLPRGHFGLPDCEHKKTSGANACAGVPGGFVPGGGLFNTATGAGQRQTLWGGTFTLQYKPAPSLISRVEFRYDKSGQNVFLDGPRASSSQDTLAFQVVYLF
jgi:hypothetical protein